MTKLRKQRQKKTFQFNRNRKRVRKSRTLTGKVARTEFWEDKKSVIRNVSEMGLALDPNKTIPIPNTKQNRLKVLKMVNGFIEEEINVEPTQMQGKPKAFVAEKLEQEANTYRPSQLRLPKGIVAQLSYFLDKYQLNYKAMVKDRRNFDQWTWKQFRAKIKKFMEIDTQFNEYLTARNLTLDTFVQEECVSDDD